LTAPNTDLDICLIEVCEKSLVEHYLNEWHIYPGEKIFHGSRQLLLGFPSSMNNQYDLANHALNNLSVGYLRAEVVIDQSLEYSDHEVTSQSHYLFAMENSQYKKKMGNS
jgi:hypothetical protein